MVDSILSPKLDTNNKGSPREETLISQIFFFAIYVWGKYKITMAKNFQEGKRTTDEIRKHYKTKLF